MRMNYAYAHVTTMTTQLILSHLGRNEMNKKHSCKHNTLYTPDKSITQAPSVADNPLPARGPRHAVHANRSPACERLSFNLGYPSGPVWFCIPSLFYRPYLVVTLPMMMLILQKEMLISAVSRKRNTRNPKAWEKTFEAVESAKRAGVSPDFTVLVSLNPDCLWIKWLRE